MMLQNYSKLTMIAIWIYLLLMLAPSIATGVILLPCDNDTDIANVEFAAETVFTCRAEGMIQWQMKIGSSPVAELLAECRHDFCKASADVNGLFVAKIIDGHRRLIVNPVNNTKVWQYVQLVNGSLVCVETTGNFASASCSLNFVYPPENVKCKAVNSSWSVYVSCTVGRIYSSRKVYKCHLFQRKDGVNNERLQTTDMVTSATSERITESEVTVSGLCQFNTTLPSEAGKYSFGVSFSSGGRIYSAKPTEDNDWFSVERPSAPTLSCRPASCMSDHVFSKCTCSSQHVGQPLGEFRLLVGNRTHDGGSVGDEQEGDRQREVQYGRILGPVDDNETWVRCDTVWGNEVFPGEIHTASFRCTHFGFQTIW